MGHKILSLLTVASLTLCLLALGLRARAADATDVLMLALPGGKCLLLTSHEGRWVAVSGVRDWPDRGFGLWSARRNVATGPRWRPNSWENAGPFLFWQRHRSSAAANVWLVRGNIAVPTDDGGKMPAYGDGVARADAANAWAGVLPNQPGWLFVSGWEVRLPHAYLVALFGVLPLLVVPVWLLRVARRRLRKAEGLCAGCGYDVRASPERCPECGRPTTRAAARPTVPSTAPSDTAPAATAP